MGLLKRLFGSELALRGWLIASLISNMGIVVTGAVVRLTASGLGCPTWPRCSEDSYVPHGELGWHGAIEFGNRLLAFVLILAALAAWTAAWRVRGSKSKLWWLTLLVLAAIPLQGVIGGFTVLSNLNPWVVAFHLLLSIALIVICTWALLVGYQCAPTAIPRRARALVIATFVAAMAAIWIGTVVTGAGPHAGDQSAVRNGLDIETVARLHSASAWVLVALVVACLVIFHRLGQSQPFKVSLVLAAAVVFQGLVGYIQYFTGLPIGVVILHMVGLSLVTAAAAWLLFATKSQS